MKIVVMSVSRLTIRTFLPPPTPQTRLNMGRIACSGMQMRQYADLARAARAIDSLGPDKNPTPPCCQSILQDLRCGQFETDC